MTLRASRIVLTSPVGRDPGFVAMKRTDDVSQPFQISAGHIVSADERAAAGKALRDKIPRHQLGRWANSKDRPDPIELLHKSDAGRMKELVAIRYGRMLQSPFAFYRGSAGIMASDLARMPSPRLKVQACGDCHLMNFGGFLTPEASLKQSKFERRMSRIEI
jgi:hypothetical protein